MKAKRMEYVSPYVLAANKIATDRTKYAKSFLQAERKKILDEETALEVRMEQRRNRNKGASGEPQPMRSRSVGPSNTIASTNAPSKSVLPDSESPSGVYDYQTSSPATVARYADSPTAFMQRLLRMESPSTGFSNDAGVAHASSPPSTPSHMTPVRNVTPRAISGKVSGHNLHSSPGHGFSFSSPRPSTVKRVVRSRQHTPVSASRRPPHSNNAVRSPQTRLAASRAGTPASSPTRGRVGGTGYGSPGANRRDSNSSSIRFGASSTLDRTGYGSSASTFALATSWASTAQQVDSFDFDNYLDTMVNQCGGDVEPVAPGDPTVAMASHSWDGRLITRSTSPLRDRVILNYLAATEEGECDGCGFSHHDSDDDGDRVDTMVQFVTALATLAKGSGRRRSSVRRRSGGSRHEFQRGESRANKLLFSKSSLSGLGSTGLSMFSDTGRGTLSLHAPAAVTMPETVQRCDAQMGMNDDVDGGLIEVQKSNKITTRQDSSAPDGEDSEGPDESSGVDGVEMGPADSSLSKVLRALQTMEQRNDAARACFETDRRDQQQAAANARGTLYADGTQLPSGVGALGSKKSHAGHCQSRHGCHLPTQLHTNVLIPLHAPPIGETFEIAAERLMPATLSSPPPPLGRGHGRGAHSLVHSHSSVTMHQYERHPACTPLAPSYECELGFKLYKQQLLRARKSRDVVFRSQNTSLAQEISKATDAIFEELLSSISLEVDRMFAQLAETVVDTI